MSYLASIVRFPFLMRTITNHWRRLIPSSARINEFLNLELSGTIQELGDLIRVQDPTVVFIAETWPDEARLRLLLKNVVLG